MKKIGTFMAVLATFLILCVSAPADSKMDLSLDMVSSYVFRGATFNTGLALQPGIEVSGLPVTLGIWGNLDIDDGDGSLSSGQISEIDIYCSYDLPMDLDSLSLSVGYTEYTYPTGGDADRELSLTAALSGTRILDMLSPSFGVFYGIDGALEKALYVELGVSHERELGNICEGLSGNLEIAVGYMAPDEGSSGFSHADITLGVGYRALSASVTYVAQIDDDVLGEAYDTELFGKIGVACSF